MRAMGDAVTARPALVAHCRAGFEAEAAADLADIATAAGTTLTVDAARGRGFVIARPAHFNSARWSRALDRAAPVFVRSLFVGSGPHALFDPAAVKGRPDRVAPLCGLVRALRADATQHPHGRTPAFADLWLETPDTNEGKELSGVCRAVAAPLGDALRASSTLAARDGVAEPGARRRLHVLFADGAHVYVGTSELPWGSPWPMGIPRLRMPRGAPSRSALKLAEAFVTFLGECEPEVLRAGMRAVDLGAAPGGWTWQLAHRGLRVTAIDNGPLKGEVLDDPLVTHLRADGLSWRPPRPVDWLVCDIVDQPARIAALVARWIADGHARQAIFNLKLPMKKRYGEVRRCEAIIRDALAAARIRHTLALRQLYHDREEVTGYLARASG